MIFKTYKFTVIQKGQWKDLKVVCPKFCTQLFFLHSVRLMILSLYENLENALRLLFLHITLWIWDLRAYVCSIVDNTLLKGRSLPNIRLFDKIRYSTILTPQWEWHPGRQNFRLCEPPTFKLKIFSPHDM